MCKCSAILIKYYNLKISLMKKSKWKQVTLLMTEQLPCRYSGVPKSFYVPNKLYRNIYSVINILIL